MTADRGCASYRVRIRSADLELEVEAPDRSYVDAKVAELLGWMGFEVPESEESGFLAPESGDQGAGKPLSLVEHVRLVSPSGGLEHVLAVGYYLEHHRGMTGGFRRRDLADGFKQLRYNHSNPGVPIASGRKQGLLMDGSETDKIRLSESADKWVRARLRGE